MARLSFTGVEEYDELFDSKLFGVWIIIAIIAGAYVLLSVSAEPAKRDTLNFFFYMTIAGVVFIPMMDRVEPSEGRKALTWAGIGFGGLLVIAFFSNMIATGLGLQVHGSNTLSLMPPNFLQLAFVGTLGLSFSTLFGTMYFVATGEEILKALGTFFFNLFEPIEEIFGITLPNTLAAQPVMWVAVTLWGLAHTILGQNPSWYALPVIADGIWLVFVGHRGGTWLACILSHTANNVFFLGLTLLHIV